MMEVPWISSLGLQPQVPCGLDLLIKEGDGGHRGNHAQPTQIAFTSKLKSVCHEQVAVRSQMKTILSLSNFSVCDVT
jgi:hypothetical protein